jgi:DNA polymerase-3 subunit alpha
VYSLHNHTCASNQRLVDSINIIEDLIQYAFDIGLKGIALTEHETVNSHIKAIKFVSKKRKEQDHDPRWDDFKLILGNEIYLCRNGLNAENYDSKKDSFYHFILIALDEEGHRQIRQLSTRAYEHSFIKSKMRRVPTYYSDLEEIIGKNPGHVVGSTACIGGYFGKTMLKISRFEKAIPEIFQEGVKALEKWCEYLQSIFGKENFFLELQPSDNQEQIYVNKWLINFAKKLEILPIVTTDSHYLKKEDRLLHKAYLNSKDGDREVDEFYATTYMMRPEEIHEYMDKYESVEMVDYLMENTKFIGERVEQYDLRKPFKLPYLPSKEDIAKADEPYIITNKLAPIWGNFLSSKEPADRVFIKRIIDKCETDPDYYWTEKRINRMNTELEVVWNASEKQNLKWSRYFLQVADYIKIAWDEGDTLVGPGRGSGVGFYLNYLLDIIQIDPMVENVPLFYWRFLNPERASILDIDSDVQSNRRNKVIEALQKHYGEMRVIRVGTERTEAAKSAILTAARGLNIDVDTAQSIAALIESDRGIQRSLKETYYGDAEKDIPPNRTFQEEMNKRPELWAVAQKIEGLQCGSGCHAGGVVIVDEDITNTNSLIKLNSGEWVTAWDLHESEEVSNVKIDLLATLNLTRMRTCLDLLVQYGYIEKKATLRETYEAAIGVYNLNRDNPEMWEKLANNEILSVFQFDTPQGIQGISLAKPTSVEEMAALNSIMRLMASEKGAEQPLEKYARFKRNPQLWDQEMNKYHLSGEQKLLLHKYLDYEYGICASQEDIMSMIQNPELGGWSLKDSDMLRKSIAKKDPKLYEELSEKYYNTVKEKNLDINLCNYFWKVLVNTQRGYSFNLSHTLAYSLVGLQNMNLACNYPSIFWNTANLIVDSAGVDEGEDAADIDQDEIIENIEEAENEEDDDEDEEEEVKAKEKVKRAKKTVDYGKIARAIGRFRSYGINILPPNVNTSSFTFTPNVEQNSITYGLRGITRISNDIIKMIMQNRPYTSFNDFMNKNHTTKLPTINLIKSGAFDDVEGIPREEIMENYLNSIADKKQRLTLQNMQMLINKELIPDEMAFYAKLFFFNKFLKTCKDEDNYELNEAAINFISNNFDADIIDDGHFIQQKKWDKIYSKAMEPMRVYLKEHTNEMLAKLNGSLYEDVAVKYGKGSISKWEMESISFYYHNHELESVKSCYDDFFMLPEEPEVEYSFVGSNGQEVKVFNLRKIVGTVIDKNKLKNTISLLTPTGVVQVKIYKNQYALYDKQISQKGEDGKKHVLEKSWFSRGTMLMIQGIRRGDNFIPKKRKNSIFPVITKIISVDGKHLEFQRERVEVDE